MGPWLIDRVCEVPQERRCQESGAGEDSVVALGDVVIGTVSYSLTRKVFPPV